MSMYKFDERELIKVLEYIQSVCVGTDCVNCPLGTNDHKCMLEEAPNVWEFNEPPKSTWRAIKQRLK